MRNRGDVSDADNMQASSLQSSDSGFSTATRTLDIDFNLFQTSIMNSLSRNFTARASIHVEVSVPE